MLGIVLVDSVVAVMGFTGTLYPFQEEAHEAMAERGTMMLCMVMGAGKTPTTIATLETLFEQDDIGRVLVVVPSSLKYQWLSEINKFSKSRAIVIDGPPKAREVLWRAAVSCRYVITNVEMLQKDRHLLERLRMDAVVVDEAFKAEHGDIILKPLYGNGGAGVFRLTPEDRNMNSLHELFSAINREPLIVQKFLPAVAKGDKRVILVDGEPIGAINRVPAAGETRSNMHVGGRPEKIALSERDREICARLGPVLRERGQVFVGIDVIGEWLTEINLTSPTGLQELERFDGINGAGLIWDAIEAKR